MGTSLLPNCSLVPVRLPVTPKLLSGAPPSPSLARLLATLPHLAWGGWTREAGKAVWEQPQLVWGTRKQCGSNKKCARSDLAGDEGGEAWGGVGPGRRAREMGMGGLETRTTTILNVN